MTGPAAAEGGRVVLGLGARARVSEVDLDFALDRALAAAGVRPEQVHVLATIDRRAAEAAVRAVAARRGWAVRAFPAAALAARAVPHPSARAAAAAGTASVAEAAALLAAGDGAELIAPKRAYPRVTVAIARG